MPPDKKNEVITVFTIIGGCIEGLTNDMLEAAGRFLFSQDDAEENPAHHIRLVHIVHRGSTPLELKVRTSIMSTDFVHLHLHTDFSLLDGACDAKKLAVRLKELDMRAVACTDHGVMSAAIDFYQTMNANNIKPIIGCEFYVAPNGIADHSDSTRHHLVLLAKDMDGYQNLCRLQAISHSKEGFYYKPRIDKNILRHHHQGLIAMSACVQGEISRNIINRDMGAAERALEEYIAIFGKENFFLEVMDHGIPEEAVANEGLLALHREYGIGLVATNDAHYIRREHHDAHDALLCIGTQKNIADEKRLRFEHREFYLKTGGEMAEKLGKYPGAIENTVKIADRCNLKFELYSKKNHYPVFRLPDESDDAKDSHCPKRRAFLRNICVNALPRRYNFQEAKADEDQKKIVERMDYELGVIDKMGFISYFLVVWDFIRAARERKIPVGPGRGSGAGSLVAYLTGITDIDPLHYKLLFERFLNPDRVSPPDFDIDFCERRRVEVIDYVIEKYGSDRVCQIGTYGTLKAKAVLKDVARVMGVSFADSLALTNLIPGNDQKMTLDTALQIPEINEKHHKEEWVKKAFEFAKILEGLNRNSSIHAAGVIIGDQPLDSVVPLARGANNELITQFPAGPCEALGLLKMDFLGLKTLTIIQDAIDIINSIHGTNLTPETIPFDDRKTYDMLNRGDTIAVFQLESGGMQDTCRKFNIDSMEDIIALIALYRPGPMQFIDTYVARKKGRERVDYDTPEMEELLRETYGIMVYQEQIMQVVQAVAGFSLAQADIMRRAIGKKKEEVLAEQGELFKKGCAEKGVAQNTADRIWEKIVTFAGYGFNKSHSAAYAFLSYRTGYLKANYPAEFMAAVLSSELGKADKIRFFVDECAQMGIPVQAPDVNKSFIDFSVHDNVILFGLGAVKGVGAGAAEAVINARKNGGPFISLADFCERTGDAVNAKKIECLIRCGAFDFTGMKRSQMVAVIEPCLQNAKKTIRDKMAGQDSLFDMLGAEERERAKTVPAPDIPEFDENLMLQDEKELIGFYISGHPLAKFADFMRVYTTATLDKVAEMNDDDGVKVAGIIKSQEKKTSRKGGNFAVIQLEDFKSTVECMVYNARKKDKKNGGNKQDDETDVYDECQHLIKDDELIFVEALVSQRNEGDSKKLIAKKIVPMVEVPEKYTRELHIHIYENGSGEKQLDELATLLRGRPGESSVIICVTCANGNIAFIEAGEHYKVKVNSELLDDIRHLLGEKRCRLKADLSVPKPKEKKYWKKICRDGAS